MRPARTAPKAADCHITWPPMVSSARAGPSIAMKAVLVSMLAAALSSWACDVYRPFTLIAWL